MIPVSCYSLLPPKIALIVRVKKRTIASINATIVRPPYRSSFQYITIRPLKKVPSCIALALVRQGLVLRSCAKKIRRFLARRTLLATASQAAVYEPARDPACRCAVI